MQYVGLREQRPIAVCVGSGFLGWIYAYDSLYKSLFHKPVVSEAKAPLAYVYERNEHV